MTKFIFFILFLVFIFGMILGSISHELDMKREYDNTGYLKYTTWVTHWNINYKEQK